MARILLIDDDDDVRTVVGMVLARCGHTVIEARDGQEGLDLFPTAVADLVITDVMMPRKDGFEVLRALGKREPPVKVIVMSGGGRIAAENPLDTARQLGAAQVLAKPVSVKALMDAIQEVLASVPHFAG